MYNYMNADNTNDMFNDNYADYALDDFENGLISIPNTFDTAFADGESVDYATEALQEMFSSAAASFGSDVDVTVHVENLHVKTLNHVTDAPVPSGKGYYHHYMPFKNAMQGNAPLSNAMQTNPTQYGVTSPNAMQGNAPLSNAMQTNPTQYGVTSPNAMQGNAPLSNAMQTNPTQYVVTSPNAMQGNAPLSNAMQTNPTQYGVTSPNAMQGNAPLSNAMQTNPTQYGVTSPNAMQGNAPLSNAMQGNAPLSNTLQGNAPLSNAMQGNAPLSNPMQGNAPLYGPTPPKGIQGNAPQAQNLNQWWTANTQGSNNPSPSTTQQLVQPQYLGAADYPQSPSGLTQNQSQQKPSSGAATGGAATGGAATGGAATGGAATSNASFKPNAILTFMLATTAKTNYNDEFVFVVKDENKRVVSQTSFKVSEQKYPTGGRIAITLPEITNLTKGTHNFTLSQVTKASDPNDKWTRDAYEFPITVTVSDGVAPIITYKNGLPQFVNTLAH